MLAEARVDAQAEVIEMLMWSVENLSRALENPQFYNCKNLCAKGIAIDSRKIKHGDIFVALIGAITDGHKHLQQAFDKGASLALMQRPDLLATVKGPVCLVPDTMQALRSMGRLRFMEECSDARQICVTGSVGKTTIKDMLAFALGQMGRSVFSTYRNQNTWIGLNWSLCNMPKGDWDTCVLEIESATCAYDKFYECYKELLHPDIVIFSRMAPAHFDVYKDVLAAASYKAKLTQFNPGWVIVNKDDEMSEVFRQAGVQCGARIASYSMHGGADINLLRMSEVDNQTFVEVMIDGAPLEYTLPVIGRHMVENSLSVILALVRLGCSISTLGFADFRPDKGRGRVTYLPGDVCLIDESYNANIVSIKAAIEAFMRIAGKRPKMLILSDMGDMGDQSEAWHNKLSEYLAELCVDVILLHGEQMSKIVQKLGRTISVTYCQTHQDIMNAYDANVKPGYAVLVKGAHMFKMDMLVDYITDTAGRDK